MILRRGNWCKQDEWVAELQDGDHCSKLPCLWGDLESSCWTNTALLVKERQDPWSLHCQCCRGRCDCQARATYNILRLLLWLLKLMQIAPKPWNSQKFSLVKDSCDMVAFSSSSSKASFSELQLNLVNHENWFFSGSEFKLSGEEDPSAPPPHPSVCNPG